MTSNVDRLTISEIVELPAESPWAKMVSHILSPPAVWAALVLVVAFAYTESAAAGWFWGAYYGVFAALIPTLFVVLLRWSGRIGDLHMRERRERILPLTLGIISAACGAISMYLLGAPLILSAFALITVVQLLLVALITTRWQISMHTSSITAATIAVILAFGIQPALLTVPLILLVTFARFHLRRHTAAQLIAGVLVGALVPVMVVLVMDLV